MISKSLQVKVNDKTYKKIQEICKEEELTVSEYLRYILYKDINKKIRD